MARMGIESSAQCPMPTVFCRLHGMPVKDNEASDTLTSCRNSNDKRGKRMNQEVGKLVVRKFSEFPFSYHQSSYLHHFGLTPIPRVRQSSGCLSLNSGMEMTADFA